MREIKFRAWDTEGKRMVCSENPSGADDFYFEFEDGTLRAFALEINQCDDPQYAGMPVRFELSPVMQFTGLRDKNGNEIWEGDVVGSDSHPDGKGKVIYELGEFTTDAPHLSIARGWSQYVEVIGNIYENPDLLTQSCS